MEFTQTLDNIVCEHYDINGQSICIGADDYTNELRTHILKIFELLILHYGFTIDHKSKCNASSAVKNDTYLVWFQDGSQLFHVYEDGELLAATKNVDDIIKVITCNINENVTYKYHNICGHMVKIGNATLEVINNYKIMVEHHGFIGNDDRLENIEHNGDFIYNGEYGFYNLIGGFENDIEYDVITSNFNDILWYMNYEFGMYNEFD